MSFADVSKKLVGSLSRAYGSLLSGWTLQEESLTLYLRLIPDRQEMKLLRPYIVSFYKDSSMKVKVTNRRSVVGVLLQVPQDENRKQTNHEPNG